MEIERVNVLGVAVSPINMRMALETIDDWISHGERHYVCVTGVHGIIESQRDIRLRKIHNNAGLVTPDGMPLVWLCRRKEFRFTERVYGPDLMLALCAQSTKKGYRNFLFGGSPDLLDRLALNLQRQFPKIQIVGTYAPPYRPMTSQEDVAVVQMINRAHPDIVWVGLGTPKQEYWMADHVNRSTTSVFIGVGAAFDFIAGMKKQAPRWMQRSGLEWFYRLASEPRRLWRRYLLNNPMFVWLILLQLLGLRHYDLSQETERDVASQP